MHQKLIEFVKNIYQTKELIPLHAPTFSQIDKDYLNDAIDSTFVSSVGRYVDQFEDQIKQFTGTTRAIAVMNGTAALNVALLMAGVKRGDIVITQAVTFVATCNALHHMGACPLFVDVSMTSLGLCPNALAQYLDDNARVNADNECVHKVTGQVIRAVMPMHTFGHPVELDDLMQVCQQWHICLIEDAAESLGSYYKGIHTGNHGRFAALSFNGNKVMTTGGGGIVMCNDQADGNWAKHLTTTAKVPHPYEFFHDEAGFNYRMPNLNAALGCAQLEALPSALRRKRELAGHYEDFFADSDCVFVKEPDYAKSNFWLNALMCPDKAYRDQMLKQTNENGIMTRPLWQLMIRLPMYKDALHGELTCSIDIENRLINLPSSPF